MNENRFTIKTIIKSPFAFIILSILFHAAFLSLFYINAPKPEKKIAEKQISYLDLKSYAEKPRKINKVIRAKKKSPKKVIQRVVKTKQTIKKIPKKGFLSDKNNVTKKQSRKRQNDISKKVKKPERKIDRKAPDNRFESTKQKKPVQKSFSKKLILKLDQNKTEQIINPINNNKSASQKTPPKDEDTPEDGIDSDHNEDIMDYIDNVELGESNAMNTIYYKYGSFFNRIRRKIGSYWLPEIRSESRKSFIAKDGQLTKGRAANFALTIDRHGNILKIELLTSSGSEIFDQISYNSIYLSERFRHPPEDLFNGKNKARFKLFFRLTVGGKPLYEVFK